MDNVVQVGWGALGEGRVALGSFCRETSCQDLSCETHGLHCKPIELLAPSQIDKLKELLELDFSLDERGLLVPEDYLAAMALCRGWLNKEMQGTGWLVQDVHIFEIFNQITRVAKPLVVEF